MTGATLGGSPATSLWIRTPLQLFWIALLLREAIIPMEATGYAGRQVEVV
jgi:hypothetical protein